VLDFSAVPVLDSTAAATIAGFARKARRDGAVICIAGARSPIRRVLLTHGVRPPHVRFRTKLADAIAAVRREADGTGEPSRPVAGEFGTGAWRTSCLQRVRGLDSVTF
jgi:SulP family sulfate permease